MDLAEQRRFIMPSSTHKKYVRRSKINIFLDDSKELKLNLNPQHFSGTEANTVMFPQLAVTLLLKDVKKELRDGFKIGAGF